MDATHVDFGFEIDPVSLKITTIKAMVIPKDYQDQDPEFREMINLWQGQWSCSLGNSSQGWPDAEDHNPAFVFGRLLRRGFKQPIILRAALQEFGRVEQCEWARYIDFGYLRATKARDSEKDLPMVDAYEFGVFLAEKDHSETDIEDRLQNIANANTWAAQMHDGFMPVS